MTTNRLSTITLIRALEVSEDWNEQESILADLRSRNDLFNLDTILRIVLDGTRPLRVRRAAVACAATHNPAKTLDFLRNCAEDILNSAGERKLAIQGLAALQLPSQTLPILENIAANRGAREARFEAVTLLGIMRNVRSAALLLELTRDRDRVIAEGAQNSLDRLIQSNGGRYQVVTLLKNRADQLTARGQAGQAKEALRVASRLDPSDGSVLSRLARLSAA
jgi:hypothetical protein